jgi:hypothetical protein
MAATKLVVPTTRIIIATDKNNNKMEFAKAKSMSPNNAETREFINQFVEELQITARNELVGLITMRPEVNFCNIMTNPTVKQGLKEQPHTFLTPNYLLVVTPMLMGFFINNYPRPDMPETFHVQVNNYFRSYNTNICYQVDFGPNWVIWLGHMLYRICPGIVWHICPIFKEKNSLIIGQKYSQSVGKYVTRVNFIPDSLKVTKTRTFPAYTLELLCLGSYSNLNSQTQCSRI